MRYTAVANTLRRESAAPEKYSSAVMEDVLSFHESLPDYAKTPLCRLSAYAAANGVGEVLVKDESHRFGLNAFKGLGGTYAMSRMLAECGRDPAEVTFVTTTDGNHGKGVSYAAKLFGCSAHVYMPKGTVPVRAEAIRNAGNADVTITDMVYDDCVKYTSELAEQNGWLLIQDTSWEGYEQVPQWIMQGYSTLVSETLAQMEEDGLARPTHVFLQAGVGAMAGAVIGCLANVFPDDLPIISIVEPAEVGCIYESVRKGDGAPHEAAGSGVTMMAGLNCGTPCTLAWDLIRDHASFAYACDDEVSAHGMRLLASPAGTDSAVISGESGAVTMGLLDLILQSEEERARLGIDETSVLLLFSTEGDTDPENYRHIVQQ